MVDEEIKFVHCLKVLLWLFAKMYKYVHHIVMVRSGIALLPIITTVTSIVWSSSWSIETKEMDTKTSNHPYKVGVPPKQKLWTEFSSTLKETFFSDDPLHSFKDQSKCRQFVLGAQAVFPILEWGRRYDLAKFKGDLIAGLTIASLCIPQVITDTSFIEQCHSRTF